MISQASDYVFVTGVNVDADHPHGDLDRISITGDIMPNLSLDPYPLRGEDIAFLYEAETEREAVQFEFPPDWHAGRTFTRALDVHQLNRIATGLKGLPRSMNLGNWLWIKDGESWSESYDCADSDLPETLFPASFVKTEDVRSDPSDFVITPTHNVLLKRDKIALLFEDLSMFNRYQRWAQSVTPSLRSLPNSAWEFSGEGEGGYITTRDNWCIHVHSSYYTIERDVRTPHTTYNLTGKLKPRQMSFSFPSINYATGIELWALVKLTDQESTRSDITWCGLLNLGNLDQTCIQGATVTFPSDFVTGVYERALAQAASDKSTGRWDTPFVLRSSSDYLSHWDEMFGPSSRGGNVYHEINMKTVYFFGICNLRDRTRW